MFSLMIVDDEQFIRNGLKQLPWKNHNIYLTAVVENSREAVAIAGQKKPDIVITDIRMPGVDGIELTRNLLKIVPDCKIIILTGYQRFDYAHEAIKLGVSEFLLKPTDPEEIFTAVEKVKKIILEERRLRSRYEDSTIKHEQSSMDVAENILSEYFNLKSDDPDNYLVKKAFEYIKMNYMKNIKLKDTAAYLGLHPNYLSRLLKKETDLTFTEILLYERLKNAVQILFESDNLISQIADMTGFSNSQYFSSVFKKIFQSSPKAFKELHRS